MKDRLPQLWVSRLTEILLLAGVIAAPLVIIPLFANFLITSKLLVLLVVSIILLALFVWKVIKSQTIEVPHSPVILGVVLFGASVLVSSILTTPYPAENLLGLGGMYIALAIITLVGSQFLVPKSSRRFMVTFNIALVLLSIFTVLQHFGFGPSWILNQLLPLNIPANDTFNLSGNLFVALQLLVIGLVSNVVSAAVNRKVELTQAISIPIIIIGLAVCIWGSLPGKPGAPSFVPFNLSWTIAVDVLKTPKSALIGFGPENYGDAWQQLKPASANQTIWWNSVVGQASDLPLTLLPTVGLFGLVAWLFLTYKILLLIVAAGKKHPGLASIILTSLIFQLLVGPTLAVAWIQVIALAYLIANRDNQRPMIIHLWKITSLNPDMHQERKELAKILSLAVPAGIAVALAFAFLWPIGQAYAASHYFFRSLLSQQSNDLNGMYTNQQKATVLNRYISGYRSNFALTSLIAARAISGQDTAKTDTATQQQISALIQQSINEARAATALRPLDSQSWEVLGQIYTSIVGNSTDAYQWAVASYTQAIQVSPTSPTLRIELGTLLYSQQKYEDAASLFQQALDLKPDLSSAAYSLANAYVKLNDFNKAALAYQRALSLLAPDSQEYKTVSAEYDQIKDKVTTTPDQSAAGAQQPATQPVESPTPTPVAKKPAAKTATGSAQVNTTQNNVTQTPDNTVQQPANQPVPSQLEGGGQTP